MTDMLGFVSQIALVLLLLCTSAWSCDFDQGQVCFYTGLSGMSNEVCSSTNDTCLCPTVGYTGELCNVTREAVNTLNYRGRLTTSLTFVLPSVDIDPCVSDSCVVEKGNVIETVTKLSSMNNNFKFKLDILPPTSDSAEVALWEDTDDVLFVVVRFMKWWDQDMPGTEGEYYSGIYSIYDFAQEIGCDDKDDLPCIHSVTALSPRNTSSMAIEVLNPAVPSGWAHISIFAPDADTTIQFKLTLYDELGLVFAILGLVVFTITHVLFCGTCYCKKFHRKLIDAGTFKDPGFDLTAVTELASKVDEVALKIEKQAEDTVTHAIPGLDETKEEEEEEVPMPDGVKKLTTQDVASFIGIRLLFFLGAILKILADVAFIHSTSSWDVIPWPEFHFGSAFEAFGFFGDWYHALLDAMPQVDSAAWNCGAAMAFFGCGVGLVTLITLAYFLHMNVLLMVAIRLKSMKKTMKSAIQKASIDGLSTTMTTSILLLIQMLLQFEGKLFFSAIQSNNYCSKFGMTLFHATNAMQGYAMFMIIYGYFIIFGYDYSWYYTVAKKTREISVPFYALLTIPRLVMLSLGLWHPHVTQCYNIKAKAEFVDDDETDEDNQVEKVLNLTGTSFALVWLFFPGASILTKLAEYMNGSIIFVSPKDLSLHAPFWVRSINWIVNVTKFVFLVGVTTDNGDLIWTILFVCALIQWFMETTKEAKKMYKGHLKALEILKEHASGKKTILVQPKSDDATTTTITEVDKTTENTNEEAGVVNDDKTVTPNNEEPNSSSVQLLPGQPDHVVDSKQSLIRSNE